MSLREGSCPGCGATLTFKSPATVLVVCPYCDSASTRSDLKLELIGKVSAVADLDSVLALGATGRMGKRSWTAVGFVQLDHGAGPWNEWVVAFDDGTTAWLAEAQGELLLTREAPVPPKPLRADLKPGLQGQIGGRPWMVAEVGEGRVVTARGELPGTLRPGMTYAYADIRGPGGGFGTIAYEDGEAPTAAFLGERIDAATLGIDRSTVPEKKVVAVSAQRLSCPSCGQSIDVRHPDESKRVGCPSCGALVDPAGRTFQALKAHNYHRKAPRLPLGSRARLRDLDVEVLAMLVRSVRVEGTRYAWSEYLLRAAGGGYRWLVENQGHWSFVEPADVGDASKGPREGTYRGRTFRHFQGGKAQVDFVIGEVYWEVRVGDEVVTQDYVDPPDMLSFEVSEKERVVSISHYLPKDELQQAFGPTVVLPVAQGIAPHQPNLAAERQRGWWKLAGLSALAVIALWVVFAMRADKRQVLHVTSRLTPETASTVSMASGARGAGAPAESPSGLRPGGPAASVAAADPNVVFSEPFELKAAKANLHLRLHAPGLDNGWLGVEGALVDLENGEVRYFALQTEHWSGTDSGESWSEGDRDVTAWLGEVPAGRYAVRLEADGENTRPASDPFSSFGQPTSAAAAVPASWDLQVTSQVPSHGRPSLLLLLLLIPPAIVSLQAYSFEKRRWSESDHAA